MEVRAAVDEAEPEGAVHGTGGMKGTVRGLPHWAPHGGDGVRGAAGPFAPVRRPPRRSVERVRLRGPSAGPVGIQDARTLKLGRRHPRRKPRSVNKSATAARHVLRPARLRRPPDEKRYTATLPTPRTLRASGTGGARDATTARPLLGDVSLHLE